jgi:hypothetical protein
MQKNVFILAGILLMIISLATGWDAPASASASSPATTAPIIKLRVAVQTAPTSWMAT